VFYVHCLLCQVCLFSCSIVHACILHALIHYSHCLFRTRTRARAHKHTHTHTHSFCMYYFLYVGLYQIVLFVLFVLYEFVVVIVVVVVVSAYMQHAIYVLTHSTFYMTSMFDTHFVFYTTCVFYAHSLVWFYLICLHIYLLQKLTLSSEAH
jgi:hypothetical protein